MKPVNGEGREKVVLWECMPWSFGPLPHVLLDLFRPDRIDIISIDDRVLLACSCLWIGESSDTHFMLGKSRLMETWPMGKYLVSTRVQHQAKSCFSQGEQLSEEDDKAFASASRELPCLSLILQVSLDLLDHTAQGHSSLWVHLLQSCLVFWAHSKPTAFQVTW